MGKPVQDDLNEKLMDADTDRIYTLDIQTKQTDVKSGKTLYLHANLDIGHDSFLAVIAKMFKKEKIKWRYWNTFSQEEQTRTGRKGEWVNFTGAIQ